MAQRSRRLAPSFVVTVAMIPIACQTSEKPPRTAEPAPIASVEPSASVSPEPLASVEPIASVEPSATASTTAAPALPPPPPKTFDKWVLIESQGKCTIRPDVSCAEMFPCPGAKPYACPTGITNYPAKVTRVGKECKAIFSRYKPMKCPPTAHCNPPPPKYDTAMITCPD